MSHRITEKMLESAVHRLNRVMGTPTVPYGAPFGNEGNYHLDHANGGVSLHQMLAKTRHGQGARDVLECGHVPKRELFGLINAYLRGVQAERTRQALEASGQ